MSLVQFTGDYTPGHQLFDKPYGRGSAHVLRSDQMELTKAQYLKGKTADMHQHPEEQLIFVLNGKLEMTVDGDTYVVAPGEASFHPSDSPHALEALEDTEFLSVKVLVDPSYRETGRLE